jgi:hypothetical protein
MNIVTTLAEKITGIEPEKIFAAAFHRAPAAAVAPGEMQAGAPPPTVQVGVPPPAASSAVAFTPQQLAAYGVRTDASGNLRLGDVKGADVLNMLELARLGERAAAAYGAQQAMLPAGVAGSR